MAFGRVLFGIDGELMWWYALLIALPYLILLLWALRRIVVAESRGRPIKRAVYITTVLSWVCALGFGFTVPDVVDGKLLSILGHVGGELWNELSIALCNPLGIIALTLASAAFGFAIGSGRKPRLSEDDLLDAAEAAGIEPGMVEHPLTRG